MGEDAYIECSKREGIGCHPTTGGYVGDCEACGGETCRRCQGKGITEREVV